MNPALHTRFFLYCEGLMKNCFCVCLMALNFSCTQKVPELPPSGLAGTHSSPSTQEAARRSPNLKTELRILSGIVLEMKSQNEYNYVRLKTDTGEFWVALVNSPVKIGQKISVKVGGALRDFYSKLLKQNFKQLYFGTLHVL